MPRRRVSFVPGGYYHVYNRGCNREPIFFEDRNYTFLLRRVKEQVIQSQTVVVAYCLMPNHYHFLLRQEEDTPISDFMQAIFNRYTKAVNNAYGRTGTLFEGSFDAIPVVKDAHLLHLCRYIHRNPVEAGLVTHPAQWPYSNYLEWVEQRPGTLVDRDFVRAHFPTPEAYERFVIDYAPSKKMLNVVRGLALE